MKKFHAPSLILFFSISNVSFAGEPSEVKGLRIKPVKAWLAQSCAKRKDGCKCPAGTLSIGVSDPDERSWKTCVKNSCPSGTELRKRFDSSGKVYFACFGLH